MQHHADDFRQQLRVGFLPPTAPLHGNGNEEVTIEAHVGLPLMTERYGFNRQSSVIELTLQMVGRAGWIAEAAAGL
jgi:hypothetical protein